MQTMTNRTNILYIFNQRTVCLTASLKQVRLYQTGWRRPEHKPLFQPSVNVVRTAHRTETRGGKIRIIITDVILQHQITALFIIISAPRSAVQTNRRTASCCVMLISLAQGGLWEFSEKSQRGGGSI